MTYDELLDKYINLSNYWGQRVLFNERGDLNSPFGFEWRSAAKKEQEYNNILIAIAEKLGKEKIHEKRSID